MLTALQRDLDLSPAAAPEYGETENTGGFLLKMIKHQNSVLRISLKDTPERFHPVAKQVLPAFIKLFEDYAAQITPLMERDHAMRKQNADGKLSEQITAIEQESRQVKDRLFKGRITSNIYVTPYDTFPSQFEYFLTGGSLHFIMKTTKKITVQTAFTDEDGCETYHRFVLRPEDGDWLIDWFGYGYEAEEGPYRKSDF